ncbi:MAG: MarC family protein [Rhodobacteraceae bacterium]|nr:MarC family protein [Paracoccaceae bacterium]
MNDVILHAFATLFVIIDPLGLVPVFIGLTAGANNAHKRTMALKGVLIGGGVLFSFALFGDRVLSALGIGLPAFRVAGGIMLFLIATEMVFGRRTARRERSAEEARKVHTPDDISVFPLAIPIMAGPGAITSVLLLMSNHQSDLRAQAAVLAVLAFVLTVCLTLFLITRHIEKALGKTFTTLLSRLLGVLLAALAAQYVMDGLRAGLLS